MKKVFIILMFGTPFPWIQQFINSVQHLEKYGWYWKIYTPHAIQSKGNVEIIKMDINQFCELVGKKTNIKPVIYITPKGIPSVHVTDYMVAYGKIFENYLIGYDFWGMMGGPDILFGRLDHFLPDSYLRDCDVFTDDPIAINGCFTLFRNKKGINKLYEQIHGWKELFNLPECRKCVYGTGTHILAGTDEYGMTEVMKTSKLRYKHPRWFPLHGHDRLPHKIELKSDGSLWEVTPDKAPSWEYANPYFGREILFYHFSQSKTWPL